MKKPGSGPARYDFLDVARGLAALLVVVEHGLHECVPGYLNFSRANIVLGQAAILLFFAISGFVIPMSLEQGQSLATFWLRRSFRLFPVYWLSIGLAFAYLYLGGTYHLDVSLSDTTSWLANLGLLQAWLHRPNVWGVFWSLHFELAFYILCSILFACGVLHRIGTKLFAAGLLGFGLLCTARLLRTKNPTDDMYNWLIVLSALFGMMAQRYALGKVTRRAFIGLFACLVGVLLFIWVVNHLLFPHVATFAQLYRSVVIVGIGFGTFLWLLARRDRHLPQLTCWLGRRSYPIYLLHPIVLVLLTPTGWPAWVFLPVLVGATLLLAELAHRFLERPGIALGRRLEQRKPREPQRETVQAVPEPIRLRNAA